MDRGPHVRSGVHLVDAALLGVTIQAVRRQRGAQEDRFAVVGLQVAGYDVRQAVAPGELGVRVAGGAHGDHLPRIARFVETRRHV